VRQGSPHVFDVWEHTLSTLYYLDCLMDCFLSIPSDFSGTAGEVSTLIQPLLKFQTDLSTHFQKELSPGRTRRALLLFSALLHDLGKPERLTGDESGRIRFLGHEQSGSELAEQLAIKFVLSNEEIQYVKQVVRQHMRIHALSSLGRVPDRRIIHRYFRDCHEVGVDICILTLADSLAIFGG
jgi:UTP:GlnB (protein PII) uridylyltransferase